MRAEDPAGYVILSTQRTGSHLLGNILGSHPAFAQAGDVLIPGREKRGSFDVFARSAGALPPASLWRNYLAHLREPKPTASYVGILVKYWLVDRIAGLDLTSDPVFADTRIVHLVRRNTLRVVASHHLATARGVHASKKHQTYEVNSVSIPPRAVLRSIQKREKTVQEFRDRLAGRPRTIEVAYEEILDGGSVSPQLIDRLCSFFEVDDRFSRKPETLKLAPEPLADLIDNYDEVASILRGTDFEYMLD